MDVDKIETVKTGQHYRASIAGVRYTFLRDGGYVQVLTSTKALGLYNIDRFDNELSPKGIRAFAAKLRDLRGRS